MESGDMFAVIRGKYLGKFLIFIEESKGFYNFLMLPGNFKIFYIKKKDFSSHTEWENVNNLYKEKYFNYVDKMPEEHLKVFKEQYKDTAKCKDNYISDIFALK